MIKQLPMSIKDRLRKNSSSEEIFNASEHKTALKNSVYQQTELIFNKKNKESKSEILAEI